MFRIRSRQGIAACGATPPIAKRRSHIAKGSRRACHRRWPGSAAIFRRRKSAPPLRSGAESQAENKNPKAAPSEAEIDVEEARHFLAYGAAGLHGNEKKITNSRRTNPGEPTGNKTPPPHPRPGIKKAKRQDRQDK